MQGMSVCGRRSVATLLSSLCYSQVALPTVKVPNSFVLQTLNLFIASNSKVNNTEFMQRVFLTAALVYRHLR